MQLTALRLMPAAPSALCCVQGVLLTHRAVASEVQSLGSWMAARGFGPDDPNDVYLSFLPLAHIYGRWAASDPALHAIDDIPDIPDIPVRCPLHQPGS